MPIELDNSYQFLESTFKYDHYNNRKFNGKTVKHYDTYLEANDHVKTISQTMTYVPYIPSISKFKGCQYEVSLTAFEEDPIISYYYNNLKTDELYLNNKDLWTYVIEFLDKNCAIKHENRQTGRNHIYGEKITYFLPVTLNKIVTWDNNFDNTINNIKNDSLFKFVFLDQTLDSRLVYYRKSKEKFQLYKQFQRINVSKKDFQPLKGKIKYKGTGNDIFVRELHGYDSISIKSKNIQCKNIQYKNCQNKNIQNMQDLQHVDYDLGENKKIHFITLMGKYNPIFKFPQEEIETYNLKNYVFIDYYESIQEEYVTNFELFIRQNGTKEWISMGKFQGNTDRWTEKKYDMNNVLARYIRFVPLSFQSSPSFQFSVWSPIENNNINASKNLNSPETKQKLIRYDLQKAELKKNYFTALHKPRVSKYFKKNPIKFSKRRNTTMLLKQEIKDFYWGRDDHDFDQEL